MPPYFCRSGAPAPIIKCGFTNAMFAGNLHNGLARILLFENGHDLGLCESVCFHFSSPLSKDNGKTPFSTDHFLGNSTHQGKYCFGKTPYQTFVDSAKLAWEKDLSDKMLFTQQPVR